MKYLLISLGLTAACLILGGLLAGYIRKKKKLKRFATICLTLLFSLVLICTVMFGYLSVYYHADDSVVITALSVSPEKIDGGYFFNGPGSDYALIFYCGAKVEPLAYAPLMSALAENGVDCFLADIPFRMALFNSSIADKFMDNYSYTNWTAAGHSLGGRVIASYAAKHADKIDNLVLLASYPGSTIPESLSFCSIYGTKDGVLNMAAYEKAGEYRPSQAVEYLIEGGNHAQFGNYGQQSGDSEAGISSQEQQSLTVEYILKTIGISQ